MSARGHHCRAREMPWGTDFEEVLKKAKRFFRNCGRFRILPPIKDGGVYSSASYDEKFYSKGQKVFEFNNDKWVEIPAGFWNE